eukprot:2637944-Prorocentrum_lima.AAC.1
MREAPRAPGVGKGVSKSTVSTEAGGTPAPSKPLGSGRRGGGEGAEGTGGEGRLGVQGVCVRLKILRVTQEG